MTSFTRRNFTIGTSVLVPSLLSSCVTPHPLDVELGRICNADNNWSDAYNGTCSILHRNILANLSITLVNFAGFFLGSIYGEPIKSKQETVTTTLPITEAKHMAVKQYQESLLPSLTSGQQETMSVHTNRDVLLTRASISDTKQFIIERRKIENSGTEAEKSRFINGSNLIERTTQQNLKSIQISNSGYQETAKMIPELNTNQFHIENENLMREEEEYHAFFAILKRG